MPSGPPVSRARAGRDIAGQVLLRGLNIALGVAVTVLVVRTLGDRGFGQCRRCSRSCTSSATSASSASIR